jgi:hypothetical protein
VWWRILFRRCAVLAGPVRPSDTLHAAGGPPPGSRAVVSFETHWMTRDETRQLKEQAGRCGVTLNDLLLRDLFLTVKDWNASRQPGGIGRCRVNVPVYVRGREGGDIPASNGIGFAFVALDPGQFADSQALLAAVHEQSVAIKRGKLALYFLGGLAIASKFKGLVPWALRRKKPFATVVLSYVGRVLTQTPLPQRNRRLVCGNVTLERLSGVPPLRALTRAAFLAGEYAGELTIALSCDPQFFEPDETRALLNAYIDRARATIRGDRT